MFSAQDGSFTLPVEAVDKPLLGDNPMLAEINDQVMDECLSRLDQSRLTEKVKALIIALLPTGAGYIEKVADQLSMTPRTLERRLKDEKTNFTILLQEVRKQLASNYIKQNTLELNEIAFLLGFSEFPAFSRAFRRWTGFLPKNFQREKQIR